MACSGEASSFPGIDDLEIIGEGLRLRPLAPDDAPLAYDMLRDDAILRWICWEGPAGIAEIEDKYRLWHEEMRQGQRFALAIARLESPGIVGSIEARRGHEPGQLVLGYWLGARYWGHGYATEAIRLMCHLCFQYLGAARLAASVFTGNTRSFSALKNNGFSLDGTLRSDILKRGHWLDTWFLTLLRTDWECQRLSFIPARERVAMAPAHV